MIFYFGNGCDKDATSYQHILLLTLQIKLAKLGWILRETLLSFVLSFFARSGQVCKCTYTVKVEIITYLFFVDQKCKIHELINQVQFKCFWLLFSSLKNDSFMIDQLYWLGGELVKYFTKLRSPNFTWEKLVNRVIFANKVRKEYVLLFSFKGIVSFLLKYKLNPVVL